MFCRIVGIKCSAAVVKEMWVAVRFFEGNFNVINNNLKKSIDTDWLMISFEKQK